MLVTFNDVITDEPIHINPKYVVIVFKAIEGEHKDKTIVGLTTGNIIVTQSLSDVIHRIRSQV